VREPAVGAGFRPWWTCSATHRCRAARPRPGSRAAGGRIASAAEGDGDARRSPPCRLQRSVVSLKRPYDCSRS
jgi:hypothetical protein